MINRVVLVGRLTREPELRKTQTGKSVVSFTLAANRRFSQVEQADFINCVAWNKASDFISNYLNKGALISVEGSIQSRSYEDAQGKRVYVQEVNAESVQSLESKAQRQEREQNTTPYQPEDTSTGYEPTLDITSDDLPF